GRSLGVAPSVSGLTRKRLWRPMTGPAPTRMGSPWERTPPRRGVGAGGGRAAGGAFLRAGDRTRSEKLDSQAYLDGRLREEFPGAWMPTRRYPRSTCISTRKVAMLGISTTWPSTVSAFLW